MLFNFLIFNIYKIDYLDSDCFLLKKGFYYYRLIPMFLLLYIVFLDFFSSFKNLFLCRSFISNI